MKKYTRAIAWTVLLVLVAFITVGCFDSTARKEQVMTEKNQEHLLNVQPPVTLDWSLERDQLNRRTELWNDPNKVSYIYLIDFGKIMTFYVIKGKVSSVNSQITNPQQIVKTSSGRYVMPSPAEDGSYGENGDAVFFFTTSGIYVETKLKYVLVDSPLQMSTPPALTQTVE